FPLCGYDPIPWYNRFPRETNVCSIKKDWFFTNPVSLTIFYLFYLLFSCMTNKTNTFFFLIYLYFFIMFFLMFTYFLYIICCCVCHVYIIEFTYCIYYLFVRQTCLTFFSLSLLSLFLSGSFVCRLFFGQLIVRKLVHFVYHD